MEIDPSVLQNLFDSTCDRLRRSVRQTNESVVREATGKLSDATDQSLSIRAVAAAALVRRDTARALKSLDRLDRWESSDAVANQIAGFSWMIDQKPQQAARCLERAVDLDPNLPDCWFYLGRIAEEHGTTEQAIRCFQRGSVLESAPHRCAITLARVYRSSGHLTEAIQTLRVSLIRDRRSADLNLALAELLKRRSVVLARRHRHSLQNRVLREALDCYRVANQVRPDARNLVAQGRLEQRLHQNESARKTFQKAVAMDATSPIALRHLAGAQVDFGDLETAVVQFKQAIGMAPDRAEFHFRYTRARRFTDTAETRRYVKQLQQLLGRSDNIDRKEVYLHFAIAKIFDDLGRYDLAWKHYELANGTKRKSMNDANDCHRSSLTRLVEHTKRRFDGSFYSKHQLDHPTHEPIFIIGLPRSGTTLTEQILSSHPEIAGAGELTMLHQIRSRISRDRSAAQSDRFGWNQLYDHVAKTPKDDLRRHARRYLEKLSEAGKGRPKVTDKMPTNFMYLGLAALLFPGATVIHCRRDPMDVLVSCYCQNLNEPFCDLERMVDYYRQYRRLMDHWKRVLPIRIYDSDYERLVADPEVSARGLVAHCGLEWSDSCLQFRDNTRAVRTPSKWQVRQPIYRTSVNKWKRFEKHVGRIAEQIYRDESAVVTFPGLGALGCVAVTR